jgi:molybdate transport system substrate-binding protein
VLVSAAASLTDAFGEVAKAFEAAHPKTRVVLNLGASSTLRTQILEGAPVDVFASADTTNMAPVVVAGRVAGRPRVFARNLLQIAVPKGNPGKVKGLADFSREKLLIGLCAPQVPCGVYARQILARAGVVPSVDTEEPDVRALLTKVEAGELDAGITYVTDVASTHGRVQGIDIPMAQNVVAAYPIALLTRAPHPQAATAFVAFVMSHAGQAILRRYGFRAP